MTPTYLPITVPNTINRAVILKRGRKPLSEEVRLQRARDKENSKAEKVALELAYKSNKVV